MPRLFRFSLVSLLTLLCQGCVSNMFYYPDQKVYDSPARHGLRYEEIDFRSADGTKLSGWFIPATGAARGTVIHFHGNAQNMSAHFGFVSWLPREGFNLFVFDYRGYGKSEGTPSRRGVFEDSVAAVKYVRSRSDIARDKLLLLGQSLGGTQAIVTVGRGERQGIKAVAVESTFFSYRTIVKDKIGQMPLLSLFKAPLSYLLIGDDLSAADYVGKIAPIPFLLLHGTDDQVIPFHHGESLMERAGKPAAFFRMEGANHLEAFISSDSPWRKRLVQFFRKATE